MDVKCITVGAFQANCWVLWNEAGHAIVIDPGDDADSIRQPFLDNHLTVDAYVLTHGHTDHISGLAALYEACPAPVALHAADMPWAFDAANQMPPFYAPPQRPDMIERRLEHGQEWQDAGQTYRIIATPGHTPGSVCLYFPSLEWLFSGDTLFAGSVGRTDLSGGNPRDLARSLAALTSLPDATTVYPGHGPSTTIRREKRANPFLQPGALDA